MITLVTFLTAKISVFQNLWTSCALPTYQRDSFHLCGDVSFYCQSKCDLFLTQSAVFREVLLLPGPLKRTELLFLHHWRVFWMLIVKYWSRLHLTAEVFISLLNHFPCNRWSLFLALSLPAKPPSYHYLSVFSPQACFSHRACLPLPDLLLAFLLLLLPPRNVRRLCCLSQIQSPPGASAALRRWSSLRSRICWGCW